MIRNIALMCFLLGASLNVAQASDNLEISGFARVVLGYFDDDSQQFRGYTDQVSIKPDSLFALRADYTLNKHLSFTAQGIATGSEVRETGVQWLYADYRPTRDWSIKLGRQRTPFFQYSDIVDVGFAYPYITLPVSVYSGVIFTEFDGVLVRYDFSKDGIYGHSEAYTGVYDGDIRNYNDTVKAKADDIFGGNISLGYNNFSVRASYQQGDVNVQQGSLTQLTNILSSFGFTESARTLQIDNVVEIIQLGFSYENLDYFVRGEYSDVASDDYLVGERTSTYLTVGINLHPMTYHLTYSHGDFKNTEPSSELMFGVSEQLDQLAFGYQQAISSLANDAGNLMTLGARYDYSSNLAFKAEITVLDGDNDSTGFLDTLQRVPQGSEGRLYQLAMEWAF